MAQTVLLVDDDAELQTLTLRFLQRAGYHVTCASNGWDAIREIVVNKPDIVVMDIEMPKLSGLNALDILRVSRLTEQVPIIVTSAHGDKDTILRAVQLGADDFIVKPYSFIDLVSRLNVHLFQLDFAGLSQVLAHLNSPTHQALSGILTGLDASRYQDWGAFATTFSDRELCVLLQQGLTLDQAPLLTEEQAANQIMVLAKTRTVWKCVWPLPATPSVALRKAA